MPKLKETNYEHQTKWFEQIKENLSHAEGTISIVEHFNLPIFWWIIFLFLRNFRFHSCLAYGSNVLVSTRGKSGGAWTKRRWVVEFESEVGVWKWNESWAFGHWKAWNRSRSCDSKRESHCCFVLWLCRWKKESRGRVHNYYRTSFLTANTWSAWQLRGHPWALLNSYKYFSWIYSTFFSYFIIFNRRLYGLKKIYEELNLLD